MNSGPLPELVFEQIGARPLVHYPVHYQHLLSQAGP